MKTSSTPCLAWSKAFSRLFSIAVTAPALWAVAALQAQDTGVEPALDFTEVGDAVIFDEPLAISAGADFEFTAWVFPTSWAGNPGFWRSSAASNGSNFNIFQGDSGRPWIRWGGVNVLRPSDGYGIPLGQWTQVKYVVKSADAAEFWTRGVGEQWVLRHSATHTVQTPAFEIFRYGWQFTTREQVQGIHNDIRFLQDGVAVAHWELNEGSGAVAGDSSGNVRPGTIDGPDWVNTSGRPAVMPASSMPFAYDFGSVRFVEILNDYTGATYELGSAVEGAMPFVDESYAIVSLPPELEGKLTIRTANAEAQWLISEEDSVVWRFIDEVPVMDPDGNFLGGANTTLADGSGDFQPLADAARGADWTYRSFGNNKILSSLGPSTTTPPDTKELVTTVTGLTPDDVLPVYALFWSDGNTWGVRAGLEYGNDNRENPWFDRNSEEVILASDLAWEVEPMLTQSSRKLYAAFLGNATVDPEGEIPVFIHDLPSPGAGTRTWYDGVAVGSGTPKGSGTYLALEVDRDSTVYIANDNSTEPQWLTSGYTRTAMTIQTTGGSFDVWERAVAARERLALPGNGGLAGENNYWVILSEEPDAITDSPDENFARTMRVNWTLRDHSWRSAALAGQELQTSLMTTDVANFSPEAGFRLTAKARVPLLQNEGENSYGLVLLGNSDSFIHAEWRPRGTGGDSILRLVDTATGLPLEEAPWGGLTPSRTNNDVGLSDGSEDLFQAGRPYFAGVNHFSDNFDTGGDPGWTSGGNQNNWEIGEPASGPGAAVSGPNVAATGLNEPYGEFTDAWFRSPAIDLTGVSAATLSFSEFTEVDTDINYHHTVVSILDADTLGEIEELSRNADQTEDWRFRQFPLSAASLGRRIIVQFRLKSDDVNLGGAGWFIDDVAVRTEEPFEITEMPEKLDTTDGLFGIRTEIDDLDNASDSYLQFNLSDNAGGDGNPGVTIFVAWDVRNAGLEPDWLKNNFERTDHYIGVSSGALYHRLWAREYSHGEQVTLGGASATGGGPFPPGAHNYFVLFGDARADLDRFYTLEATGIRENGEWSLSFMLTDENGFSATVQTTLAESMDGRQEFGVAARHPDASDAFDQGPAVWETFSLTMDYLVTPTGITFAGWSEQHFTPGQLADPEISGPAASPAGDGVANLMKYALDLNPWILVAASDLPQFELDQDGRLILLYWERTDASDILYIPEVSEDLATWESGPVHVEETFRGPIDGNFEEVEVRGSVSAGAGEGFIHLRVEKVE